jgi:mono/diheme cytochrome c family protein
MSEAEPSKSQLEQAGASDDSIQDVHAALLREKAEPSEGTVPVPLLLLALVGGLVFFSGVYLGRYSGGFDALTYNENAPTGAAVAAAATPADPAAVGKRLFAQNCASCHQVTGQGLPGVYPPLAASEWVNGTEERTVRILLEGLSGPVTVAGNQFGAAQMPSFGPTGANWKDDKIAAVLTYIRQEWGNKGAAVTVEQVAKVRTANGNRGKAWTSEELLKIAP